MKKSLEYILRMYANLQQLQRTQPYQLIMTCRRLRFLRKERDDAPRRWCSRFWVRREYFPFINTSPLRLKQLLASTESNAVIAAFRSSSGQLFDCDIQLFQNMCWEHLLLYIHL